MNPSNQPAIINNWLARELNLNLPELDYLSMLFVVVVVVGYKVSRYNIHFIFLFFHFNYIYYVDAIYPWSRVVERTIQFNSFCFFLLNIFIAWLAVWLHLPLLLCTAQLTIERRLIHFYFLADL